jgi:2-oxo-4-hydroxy-4-carboxy-5-ureidoimidazoline decarboxylase
LEALAADGDVDEFNALADDEARQALQSCLDVSRWVDEMLAGRPYETASAALERASQTAATLSADEVEAALARHPRIGERAGEGHDTAFSEAEQSGVDRDDAAVAQALAAGNAAYERRFDRVFLIRAAGRSSEEILAELHRRLDNSDEDELAEVIRQLGEIALIRLGQVIG